jgi:hypothetical protein
VWGSGEKIMRKIDLLQDPGVDERIILRIFRGCEVMDCIELAQDKNRWRALVIAVMNLRVL